MSLYHELKRRNVIRVAIAYLALAWLVTEVAGTVFPAFGIPDWGVRFFVIAFALGFVPALIISWVYEITPEGLKREKDVVRDASITHLTAKRLDGFTIGLIVVALAFILADRLWLSPRLTEQTATPAEVAIETVQTPEPEPQYSSNSIAVLPFANRSNLKEDEFFTDGIHDDLLTTLAKIGSMKVISRTSVLRYRETEMPIPEIARELGVATVLEGGIQRSGSQVRINVQLIDATTDEHIWAETYDRQLTVANIFAIQTEIARAIAEAMQDTLLPPQLEQLRTAPTENLAAYEVYLLGKHRMAERTSEALAHSVDYFQQAVDLDPSFALAWVGLSDCYLLQIDYSGLPRDEMLAKSELAIDKSLTLDGHLGEAYVSLGGLENRRYRFEAAEAAFSRALELNPNYATAYHWYGSLLDYDLGRTEDALVQFRRGVQLDPLSASLNNLFAHTLRKLGRFEEALAQHKKVISFHPGYLPAYKGLGLDYWAAFARPDHAVLLFKKGIPLDPNNVELPAFLALLYLDLGDEAQAKIWIDRSLELRPKDPFSNWAMAWLQLYRGDKLQAVSYARKVVEIQPHLWEGQALAILRNQDLQEGRYAKARTWYEKNYPALLNENEPKIDRINYRPAIDLALVLTRTGEQGRANLLLERSLAAIRDLPRLGEHGYGISDVQIYSLQGNKTGALTALRQAIDQGWRFFWWHQLENDPNLDSIRSEPEFQVMVEEIETDMAEQLERIREMERNDVSAPAPGLVIEP